MDRSQINTILREADAMIRAAGFTLPPFAHLSPEDLARLAGSEVVARRLGWDVTDYGAGDFTALGLALFTLRNGRVADLAAGRGMLYAEKLLVLREGQYCPMHTHRLKAEDIIHRWGAGWLEVELFGSTPDGGRDLSATVTVTCDGLPRTLPAGGRLVLHPGESVTLMPGDWHAFRARGGDLLLGEVSTVNDDETDNVFDPPLPRFASVHEDAPPWRWLVSDYPALSSGDQIP
jgi:D-lyxose ketol-isomerase